MDRYDHTHDVRRLHQRGMSQAAIAREIGVSRQRVWQLIRDMDLGANRPTPEERRNRLPQLLRQGLLNFQIARALGTTPYAIEQDLAALPDREALLEARRLARPSWRRRHQIPELIRKGLSTPEIARALGVGITTIRRDIVALELPPALHRKCLANGKAAWNRKRLERLAAAH
ncbi:MAG: DeoR family transcriptional regulator [Luteimonas sp.]